MVFRERIRASSSRLARETISLGMSESTRDQRMIPQLVPVAFVDLSAPRATEGGKSAKEGTVMGEYSLIYALSLGKADLVAAAVAKGCDVNETDYEGNTPLLLACQSGNLELAMKLKDAGAKVSVTNRRGDTPLLVASKQGSDAMVRMLLDAADKNGKAAFETQGREKRARTTQPQTKCTHGRRKSRCVDCGGGSICTHRKQRAQCKYCGGASICEHNRVRSNCKDCGGASI